MNAESNFMKIDFFAANQQVERMHKNFMEIMENRSILSEESRKIEAGSLEI